MASFSAAPRRPCSNARRSPASSPVTDDQIDLEPVLREALALSLPTAPLCSEDCAGPDPGAHPVGRVTDDEAGDESPALADPRWAVLDQLRTDR